MEARNDHETKQRAMNRLYTIGPALLFGVACGARSSLSDPEAGVLGGGGLAPQGGGGAGGDGGALFACPALQWVLDPVHVPIAGVGPIGELKLIALDANDFAVTFEAEGNGQPFLGSFAVREPFSSWPPVVSTYDASFPISGRSAVSESEPGLFGFAAFDGGGSLALGYAAPGESGSTFVSLSIAGSRVHALARNALGQYLVGAGSDGFLSLYGVESLSPGSQPLPLGVSGCASPRVLASAAASAGAFLLASAVDAPFDDCLDPDVPGPATVAQIQRVDPAGAVVNGSYLQRDAALTELMIAPRTGGAWLGLRDDGSGNFAVYEVSNDGVFDEPYYQAVSGSAEQTHALTAIGPTVAFASLLPSDVQPGGDFVLTVVIDFAPVSLMIEPFGSIFPLRGPTLAASSSGRSLLVAFVESDQPTPSVVVWRADCVDGVE
jgi:hypothetical protein